MQGKPLAGIPTVATQALAHRSEAITQTIDSPCRVPRAEPQAVVSAGRRSVGRVQALREPDQRVIAIALEEDFVHQRRHEREASASSRIRRRRRSLRTPTTRDLERQLAISWRQPQANQSIVGRAVLNGIGQSLRCRDLDVPDRRLVEAQVTSGPVNEFPGLVEQVVIGGNREFLDHMGAVGIAGRSL